MSGSYSKGDSDGGALSHHGAVDYRPLGCKLTCDLRDGDPVQIALGRAAKERVDVRNRTGYGP